MTRAEQFEELRPMLSAIAYRILGSVSEAEDAVQETWLRYESSPTQPTSTKAFLSAVVTRGAGAAPHGRGTPSLRGGPPGAG
jgi:RNA polymerase sigma-70 factor (ECF subfamily)